MLFENPKIPLKHALVAAGYAPSTAAAPSRNGLKVSQCLDAAREMKLIPSDQALLGKTRRLAEKKLDSLLSDDRKLDKVRLSEVARMLQVSELSYGGPTVTADGRAFGDRLAWLHAAMASYRKAQVSDPSLVDIGSTPPVDVGPTTKKDTQANEKESAKADGT